LLKATALAIITGATITAKPIAINRIDSPKN
jgi:hypothetical protein